MRTIFRYSLSSEDHIRPYCIELLYAGWVPRHVGCHHRDISLWAEVDTDQVKVEERFVITESGEKCPDDAVYLGTVQSKFRGDVFVWHIWHIPRGDEG